MHFLRFRSARHVCLKILSRGFRWGVVVCFPSKDYQLPTVQDSLEAGVVGSLGVFPHCDTFGNPPFLSKKISSLGLGPFVSQIRGFHSTGLTQSSFGIDPADSTRNLSKRRGREAARSCTLRSGGSQRQKSWLSARCKPKARSWSVHEGLPCTTPLANSSSHAKGIDWNLATSLDFWHPRDLIWWLSSESTLVLPWTCEPEAETCQVVFGGGVFFWGAPPKKQQQTNRKDKFLLVSI